MADQRLEDLACQLRTQVKSCEHFNPNVGQWARHEVRSRLRGYRVAALLSQSRVEIEVKGLDTQVSFSLNAPDRVCLLNRPLRTPLAGLSCPVFVAGPSAQATTAWLQASENVVLLSRFRLSPAESLQVYRNAVVLIGEVERANEQTIAMVCDVADRVRDRADDDVIDGLPFVVDKLPPDLQSLSPLVRRFAVGDDAIRGDLMSEASEVERAELRAQVEPLLPRINAFLDSFGKRPLSNEAMLIGRLAEAVVELGRREA